MKKKGILFVFIVLISIVTITAVRYLSTDHTVSDCYYTQIPCVDVNRESWLIDDYGHKQPIGKEYVLDCFNVMGERKRVTFINTYSPGTYIKLKTNKNVIIDQRVVSESEIPQRVLNQIKHYGRT